MMVETVHPAEINQSKPRLWATRLATYDERDAIVRLYIENLWPIAHLPPDTYTVCQSVFQAIAQNRVFVVTRAGEIVGCASFVEGTYWYTPQKCLFDTGLFVVKHARKTRALHLLKEAMKGAARERGALLIIGAGTTDETAAALMKKRDKQIGAAYLVET